ncbi:MAG: response regulator [Bacteroidetes bacterium]|nr:response regulator [Bacteroidota bacterium]MCW5895956.1 response regulator [Bacteroidota bacterium]
MKTDETILLVEDDVVDAMTVKRALREINVTNNLVVKANGEEALSYLRDTGNPRPCIIILDLNMPKMNGLELLKALKQDEHLRRIPAVVLTTSKAEQDRFESFNLSVAGYMIKPVEYPQFVDVVRNINLYWTLSELPD